jgi:hypothetical protein
VNDQEIRRLWASQLQPVRAENLPDGEISATTRRFLTDVGLPGEAPLEVTFHQDDLLVPLDVDGVTYLKVGDDYGTQLGIEAGTERVWAVDLEGSLPRRFVNSSLADFVAALGIYAQSQPELRTASDEQAAGVVDRLRNDLSKLDAPALRDPESWWSVILEQTADGLL